MRYQHAVYPEPFMPISVCNMQVPSMNCTEYSHDPLNLRVFQQNRYYRCSMHHYRQGHRGLHAAGKKMYGNPCMGSTRQSVERVERAAKTGKRERKTPSLASCPRNAVLHSCPCRGCKSRLFPARLRFASLQDISIGTASRHARLPDRICA